VAGLPEEYRAQVGRLARLGKAGLPYNLDSWDGYPADRQRLYDAFKATGANPIVLSGDSHAFWANELFGEGEHRLAAEFGATGITSPGAGDVIKDVPLDQGFADSNKEVVFTDQAAKGFVLLTLTRDSAKGELMAVSTILETDYTVKALKTYAVTPIKGGGVEALKEI
jgi:alkaline phosphatase D